MHPDASDGAAWLRQVEIARLSREEQRALDALLRLKVNRDLALYAVLSPRFDRIRCRAS